MPHYYVINLILDIWAFVITIILAMYKLLTSVHEQFLYVIGINAQ